MSSTASKIRELRESKGLTQEQLAEKAEINPVQLSKYERGLNTPGSKTLSKLAKALDVTMDELSEGEEKVVTPMMKGLHGSFMSTATSNCNAGETSKPVESEFVLVPRYNVSGSCGGGALVENEEIVDYLSFRREWIKNSLRIGEKSLAVINVKGDSMEPRLRDGDLVLLDTSTKHVECNAIYALQFNGGLSIKRVQRFMSGALEIISDNKTYKTEMIPPEQANSVRVVGRVVWAGGKV